MSCESPFTLLLEKEQVYVLEVDVAGETFSSVARSNCLTQIMDGDSLIGLDNTALTDKVMITSALLFFPTVTSQTYVTSQSYDIVVADQAMPELRCTANKFKCSPRSRFRLPQALSLFHMAGEGSVALVDISLVV